MAQQQEKGLEDIWNGLLQLHWEYLETEENMQKIEMRKRLEGIVFVLFIILKWFYMVECVEMLGAWQGVSYGLVEGFEFRMVCLNITFYEKKKLIESLSICLRVQCETNF